MHVVAEAMLATVQSAHHHKVNGEFSFGFARRHQIVNQAVDRPLPKQKRCYRTKPTHKQHAHMQMGHSNTHTQTWIRPFVANSQVHCWEFQAIFRQKDAVRIEVENRIVGMTVISSFRNQVNLRSLSRKGKKQILWDFSVFFAEQMKTFACFACALGMVCCVLMIVISVVRVCRCLCVCVEDEQRTDSWRRGCPHDGVSLCVCMWVWVCKCVWVYPKRPVPVYVRIFAVV